MEKHIELGGKPYVIDYNTNAMCEAEERTGLGIRKWFDRDISGARIGLWAGLITHNPKITFKDVGTIIDEHCASGGSLADIVTLAMNGMKDAGFFGEAAKKPQNQAKIAP